MLQEVDGTGILDNLLFKQKENLGLISMLYHT